MNVKLFITLTFMFALLGSAFAELRIESHRNHSSDEVQSAQHSHRSHQHSGESAPTKECPHLHFHCSSLCFGLMITQHDLIPSDIYYSVESIFELESLRIQKISSSLYRPPIS